MKSFYSRQFIIFILTGGTAAGVNFGSRIVLNYWFGFSTAVIIAYILGMITAFILAKCFVFENTQQALHESILFFVLVNVVAVMQTWVLSMCFAYYLLPYLGISAFVKEISHAVGVIVPVFTSYIGHKKFSFR